MSGAILFRVEQRGAEWVVTTEDGSRVLGRHKTKGEAEAQLRAIEANKMDLLHVFAGDLHRLEVERGADGKIRTGIWDRGATFGEKIKEGVQTVFSVETFNQFMDNWLRRGEMLALNYNHQSAYVEVNGQPAPALAFYDAIAIVSGHQVVRFERLNKSNAQAPNVEALQQQVSVLSTAQDPMPTYDGLWFYRAEVTEIGDRLLPGFRYISPMFSTNGKDQQGNEQGYTLYDLAATNTAFQPGCIISFEGKPMNKIAAAAKVIGLDAASEPKSIKQAFARKMEEEAVKAMEEEGYNYEDAAARLEEMARAYEDANFEEEDGDDKADHVVMRKMAAKFRRMAKMAAPEPHAEPDGDEPPPKMEDDEKKQMQAFAERLGIQLPANATAAQMLDAIKAATVPTSQLSAIVDAQVKRALASAEQDRVLAEAKVKARALVNAAIAGGYPKDQEQALLTFASDPKTYPAAETVAKQFIKMDPERAILFDRMTHAGAPVQVGGAATRDNASASDARVVRMEALSTDAVVYGERFADAAREMADSQDPKVRAKIDSEMPEGAKGSKYEAFERLYAANRVLKRERPELWRAMQESAF